MSSAGKYAVPVDVNERWNVAVNSPTQFTWEYDDGRDRLLSLYQKGKDKQWDATKRIDWSLDVEPHNPIGLPDEFNPFRGVEFFGKMSQPGEDRSARVQAAWTWSPLRPGEQGAMVVSARIVESVPGLASKFY